MQRGLSLPLVGTTGAGRNVYASSAKISGTTAPSESTDYISSLKTGASRMKQALRGLTSGTAFKQKTAASSDTDVLTVKQATQHEKYGIASGDISVKVSQIAQGQENSGTALKSSEASGVSGYQQFQIEVGGKTRQFSISIGEGDTNKQLQDKMAALINEAGIGITASVETSGASSTLSLKSNATGDKAANIFKISDVMGSLVSKTGIGNTTKEAQDAIYSVNGVTKNSSTNSVDLGNGIMGTLLKASDKEVKVSQQIDSKAAIDEVQKLADSYNTMFGAAFKNDTDSKANNLLLDLNNTARTYLSSLSAIGIGFDSNGNMTVNKSIMEKAAGDGSLERFFTQGSGKNYGFTNQLEKVANNVDNKMSRYVGAGTFTYAGSGFTFGSSSAEDAAIFRSVLSNQGLTNSWNMKNMYVGLLFNGLF